MLTDIVRRLHGVLLSLLDPVRDIDAAFSRASASDRRRSRKENGTDDFLGDARLYRELGKRQEGEWPWRGSFC